MKYQDILARLSSVSPDEYEFEARVLIESFTGKKISYVITHPDEEISSEALQNALRKREDHIPLQYIIGKWDFFRQT